MLLSLILVSNNRERSADFQAKFLSENRFEDVELIIVFDRNTPRINDPCEHFEGVKHICSFSSGRIGQLRNVGVHISNAASILLVDDDCEMGPDYLDVARSVALRNEITRGKITFWGTSTFAQADVALRDDRYDRSKNIAYAPNLIVPRSRYLALGGLDERFRFGSDGEFSDRVTAAGVTVNFEERMAIRKKCDDGFFELWGKSFRYARGRRLRWKLAQSRGEKVPPIPIPKKINGSLPIRLVAVSTLIPRIVGFIVG